MDFYWDDLPKRYDLINRIMVEPENDKVYIIRIEQLYPFPVKTLAKELKSNLKANKLWMCRLAATTLSWALFNYASVGVSPTE